VRTIQGAMIAQPVPGDFQKGSVTTAASIRASAAKDSIPDLHLPGIRDVLYKTAGIFQPDHELNKLEKRCQQRMKDLGVSSLRDYSEYLKARASGQVETALLLNEILVGDTGFFRGLPQLDALGKIVLPKLIAAKSKLPSRSIKIWSAGCSTGEEACTLAITLLEASSLLDGWTCTILATDINEQAVEHARNGVYGIESILSLTPGVRQKYFLRDGDALSVCPPVRNLLSFQQLNLLDNCRMSSMSNIDVIFCRNVLAYFDMTAKAQVLEHFHNSLLPGGMLFLGPTESLFGVTTKFSLVHLPSATAYAKAESQLAKKFLP